MRREKRGMTDTFEHKLPQIMTAFMAVVCAVILLAPSVFADDADGQEDDVLQAAGTESSVTVSIICSKHGYVNDKTGEFSETVSSGSDLHLSLTAEEGYLIGKVLINDESLAAADLEGIEGEQSGQLDLEGLEENLSLQVVFMTPEDYADQEISPGTTDDPSAGGGSDDTGTDIPGDDPGITDPEGQNDPGSGDPAEVTDPSTDDTGDAGDGSESDDEGFDPDDDWGAEDDAVGPDSDEYQGTYDDGELGTQESQDAETDSDAVTEESDTESQDETTSDGVAKSTGTAASKTVSESDTDSDEDEYKGDYGTPKTGDDSLDSAAALLLMGIGFLYLACVLTCFEQTGQKEGGDSE